MILHWLQVKNSRTDLVRVLMQLPNMLLENMYQIASPKWMNSYEIKDLIELAIPAHKKTKCCGANAEPSPNAGDLI